jgi:acyclic terpene utilization AtuA family protein
MPMEQPLRIGNAQGFWGDAPGAPAQLVAQAPNLDCLTLDYLAEVSMSILAKQRERDASAGYARDFIGVVESLVPVWKSGGKLQLITNAGGLNPRECATVCARILRNAGCHGMRIGVISGDDVLPMLRERPELFPHLESGAPLSSVADVLVTANAYLGAASLVEAILSSARIIITGRVADPSLTVAPCIAHFNWPADDWNRIAGATVAGHLIECGTQVTGGISTNWMNLNASNIGYPIVEISADGSCVVTKPAGTGGAVNEQTVKEQLLYEIGDPAAYLSPDATVSFLSLRVTDQGDDRVRVYGATGGPPPGKYKVSATFRAGFRASGLLTVFGRDAVAKARRCGQLVLERLRDAGCKPHQSNVECLGAGDVAAGLFPAAGQNLLETVLRVTVADPRREIVDRFTREMAPLITNGPQGVTGYGEGRPAVHEVFGYWPTLIDRSLVRPEIEFVEV